MPELRLQPYTKTKPSTIYGHNFLDLPEPDSPIGGFEDTQSQKAVALSCVLIQAIAAGTSVQFQTTSISEGGVFATVAGMDESITETNLIDSEAKQIMDLIFRIRVLLPVPYSNKLADRLITLFYDAQEEDPQSVGPSIDSFHTFYDFLKIHNDLKMPSISLTPENLIYASWRAESKIFSVIFAKSQFVHFFVFAPDNRDPNRNVRLSGAISVENLLDTVQAIGVLNWISDDRRQDP